MRNSDRARLLYDGGASAEKTYGLGADSTSRDWNPLGDFIPKFAVEAGFGSIRPAPVVRLP